VDAASGSGIGAARSLAVNVIVDGFVGGQGAPCLDAAYPALQPEYFSFMPGGPRVAASAPDAGVEYLGGIGEGS
jgi:hypothetical protein